MSTRREQLVDITLQDVHDPHAELWLDRYMDNQDSTKRACFIATVATLAPPAIYEAFYTRWIQQIHTMGAKTCPAHVRTRMIVGLGNESVLETSITLHPTYGVPYIPGSALKGLAASYARQRLSADWQKASEAYQVLFGSTEEAGYITFFDALYIPNSGHHGQALYPDVITVHHQDYYQSPEYAPADWDNPVPVPFLTATGCYMLALAATNLDDGDTWIERTFTLLTYALDEMGIGAKTSSGYGRLEVKQTHTIGTNQQEQNT